MFLLQRAQIYKLFLIREVGKKFTLVLRPAKSLSRKLVFLPTKSLGRKLVLALKNVGIIFLTL